MTAASIATGEFWSHAEITVAQEVCYDQLRWLELRLGRFPQALAWHELHEGVEQVLVNRGYDPERLASSYVCFDMGLGMLILKSDIWRLKNISRLPDVLSGMRLVLSSGALRFALGHEPYFPEQFMPKNSSMIEIEQFCAKWVNQPAAADLPADLLLYDQRKVTLSSVIVGCKFAVETENCSPCVELAESILAALESLLATGIVDRVMPREPLLTITIRKAQFTNFPFIFEPNERDGRPHIEISCGEFNAHMVPREVQTKVKDKLFELLAHVSARVFFIDDLEESLRRLFHDELALDRAIHFTSSFISTGNILGHDPKTTTDRWLDPNATDYPLKRLQAWNTSSGMKPPGRVSPEKTAISSGSGAPPAELSNLDQTRHTDFEVFSLIREALWDRAGWQGTAFFLDPAGTAPPVIAPFFSNSEAAAEIFAHWRRELGLEDEEDRLRLSLIRGINRHNPHAYRILIGVNPPSPTGQSASKAFVIITRRNRMEPSSALNLQSFLAAYRLMRNYILAYATPAKDGTGPELVEKNLLIKRTLYVREAWEIGRNDIDMTGICHDDDPVIPPDRKASAPVLEVLRFLNE